MQVVLESLTLWNGGSNRKRNTVAMGNHCKQKLPSTLPQIEPSNRITSGTYQPITDLQESYGTS